MSRDSDMPLPSSIFKSIFNISPVGFLVLSPTPEAIFLAVNDAFLEASGRKREDLLHKSIFETFPCNGDDPDDIGEESLRGSLARVRSTGKPDALPEQRYPIEMQLPDGRVVWEVRYWSVINTPVFGEDGQLLCICHSTNDVTGQVRSMAALRQSEEKLRDTDRRKDEFLAMLAHELRNPLAPIGAAAQLLQLAHLDETQIRKTSEVIGRQVLHMTGLIDDLLDVSRVTRGLIELEDAPLDIRHVVMEAVEQVTPLIQAKQHRLILHLTPHLSMVKGDRKRLVQIISNTLNNAAKYTPEGGEIQLRTDVQQSHILIETIDNGVGMTPELTARAFDLFAQAERTSDRSSGGLGLGLALVKSLVELHGGKVSCESRGLGEGSKFTVCLPRLGTGEPLGGQVKTDVANLQAVSNSLRILVVDDNLDASAMLALLLETSGDEVLVQQSSAQALTCALRETPQVCLLDIGLPDMNGNELARRLRAHPQTANMLLIAVTGYSQAADREEALNAGFDHYLVKPVDMKKLYAILADARHALA